MPDAPANAALWRQPGNEPQPPAQLPEDSLLRRRTHQANICRHPPNELSRPGQKQPGAQAPASPYYRRATRPDGVSTRLQVQDGCCFWRLTLLLALVPKDRGALPVSAQQFGDAICSDDSTWRP